jgi:amicyanin
MRIFLTSVLVAALLVSASGAAAQSLLDHSPNVSGDWTGSPGTLYFHFLHRFSTSSAPERKVSNVPTFLLGTGLPKRLFAGLNYSTNSSLAPRFPNEWELFGRWLPLAQDYGNPLDVGAQLGYNNAAQGVDAELSVARRQGVLRLLLAGRTLTDPLDNGHRQFAGAGGAVVRLGTYAAITGDVATVTDRAPGEKVAWSAGLHVAIPLTPHTISLQATNTLVNTLQGASRGTSDVRYGFEFTIPLTLRRYFGKRVEETVAEAAPDTIVRVDTVRLAPRVDTVTVTVPAPATRDSVAPAVRVDTAARPTQTPPARADSVVTPPTRRPVATPPRRTEPARVARSGMKNLAYLKPRMEVSVGTTVEWTNNDPLPHSVTAVDKSFNSGLIYPGKTYRHTFTKPGTYDFYCMPHPFMKGTVVVTGGAR